MSGDYKELIVWQKAMDLVEMIYKSTHTFPAHEIYGLTSQMRRAAVSIPSNIAEGKRRISSAEFKHFCRIAFGSSAELETQVEIAFRLKYLDTNARTSIDSLLSEVLKMLNVLCS